MPKSLTMDSREDKRGRLRVQLYLPSERKKALARYALEHDTTASAVMEEALDRMGVFGEDGGKRQNGKEAREGRDDAPVA